MKRFTIPTAALSSLILVASLAALPSAGAAVAPSNSANPANAGQPEALKTIEKSIHVLLVTLENEKEDVHTALLVAHGSMNPARIARALAFVSKSNTFAQDYAQNLEAVRVAIQAALDQLASPDGVPPRQLKALRSELKKELSRVTKLEQAAHALWPSISPIS